MERVSKLTREEALALLQKYNKEPFHILHGLTVEGVMRWYSEKLGYGDEAEYWGITGLLHDVDFEQYPGAALHQGTGTSARGRSRGGYDYFDLLSWIWNLL